jgi:hypothetical protein
MANKLVDYRDIDREDLNTHFDIGHFTDGDSKSRQTKTIPTYQGEMLQIKVPWMFSRFGWGGKYDTLTLQSSSKGKFPKDSSKDKKSFRHFLENLASVIEEKVVEQPNPHNLSTSVKKQFEFDQNYHYYKYYFNFSKKYFDGDGEFEGQVFRSDDPENPEYTPSSIKAIKPNSYVEMVAYIGHIVQTQNCIRFNIVVKNINWCPGNQFLEKTEEEKLGGNVNLFMNVPSITKKRKVNVNVDYKESDKEDEDIEDLSSSKKVKV